MAGNGSKIAADKPVQKPVRTKAALKAGAAGVVADGQAASIVERAVAAAPVAAIETGPEVAPQDVVNVVETQVEETAQAAATAIEAAAEKIEEPAHAVLDTATHAAAQTVEPVAAATRELHVMETIENNFAKAQSMFGELNERTKAAVEKSTRLVEEANDFAKGNLEAVVESGRIAANGMQSLGQDAAEYGRKSFEQATAALKGMAAVKSPTELFKLQSDFFRTSFDSYVAEASKNTEALIKLAGDAAQPLSNRVAVAVEKVKVAA